MIWVASVLVRLGDKPNKKEGCGCCPASSSLLPAAHISFSGNSTHMDTCTFPYWALTGRRRGGGGRLIKTLRAVLDLTGWVKHTKHSLLLISTKNMPAHWCVYSFKASHTPKRYHFLCQPAKLQLFFFFSFLFSPSLLPLFGRQNRTKTPSSHSFTFYPALTQNQSLLKSEQADVPDVLLNVLMWLNVLSQPAALEREIFLRGWQRLCGSVSSSAFWRQSTVVCGLAEFIIVDNKTQTHLTVRQGN